jgi:hypothetical protein
VGTLLFQRWVVLSYLTHLSGGSSWLTLLQIRKLIMLLECQSYLECLCHPPDKRPHLILLCLKWLKTVNVVWDDVWTYIERIFFKMFSGRPLSFLLLLKFSYFIVLKLKLILVHFYNHSLKTSERYAGSVLSSDEDIWWIRHGPFGRHPQLLNSTKAPYQGTVK